MDTLFATLLASPEFQTFFIGLIISTIGTTIAFVGKSIRDLLNRKLSAEQLHILMTVAREAVVVAEQTGLGKAAEEKKAEALRVANAYLTAYGMTVTAEQLDAAIEAAVFGELTQFKDPLPEAAPA